VKLNLAGIALKRFQNANRNKRNTQKSRSKSFLLNFVSIFRTAINDDYGVTQCHTIRLTALRELGIPAAIAAKTV